MCYYAGSHSTVENHGDRMCHPAEVYDFDYQRRIFIPNFSSL